jgi:hypothetical protein
MTMGDTRKKKFPPDSVCKPCWELKYCPYGQLVEMFPGPGTTRTPAQVQEDYELILKEFTTGTLKTEDDVWGAIARLEHHVPWTTEEIRGYDPEEVGCKIWGHVCPVFFVQSGATETKEDRRTGRHIPRDIMLKVVRRDDHVCQKCFKYVPDNELEFDHTIPVSRGGPTSVENIKLYCRSCNREKSNKLTDILIDR